MATSLWLFVWMTCLTLNLQANWARGQGVDNVPNEESDDLRPVNYFLTSEAQETVREKLICRGWPCPKFRVKQDHSFYVQEREYKDFDIVSATVYGCGNFSSSMLQGYMALFRYRRGNNSESRAVKMAVPVVVEVTQVGTTHCMEKYKTYVFVNSTEDANGPPEPVESNVQLERIENLDVYVHTFSGYFDQPEAELVKLQEDVHQLNLCFNPKRYMVALYDPPWKKKGRRNEIWIDARECSSEN